MFAKLSVRWFYLFTFLVFLLTVIINYGLVALDEFNHSLVLYIPAQTSTFAHIVAESGLRSPLQVLPFHLIAQGLLALGIQNPLAQHHLVIIITGMIGLFAMLWAISMLFAGAEYLTAKKIALLALGLHFLSPFLLTRPMFEATSAPWLLLSAAFAFRYYQEWKLHDLLLATVMATVSFLLRPHVGICALGLLALSFMTKPARIKDFFWLCALGLVFFIATGLPDYFLRGRFHDSLIVMATYNVEHGGMYCKMPFYYFFIVILAVTFSPFFIARYPWAEMKKEYWRLRILWIYVALLVAMHMLFENKYERYLLPVLPILLMLLVPMLTYMVRNFSRYKVRLSALIAINAILLVPTSFIVSQKTMFDFADYINAHPEIKTLAVVERSISPLPFMFFNHWFEVRELTLDEVGKVDYQCDELVGIREDLLEKTDLSKLSEIAVLEPGPLEKLLIKTNPESNGRRRPIHLYSACGGPDLFRGR